MLIRDIMNVNATRISARATMKQAAELVSLSQASDLMVVDDQNHFVGVLSEGDLIRAILPRFEELMESGGSLTEAFRVFADHGREHAERPIGPLVIKSPVIVRPEDEVLKAATAMVSKQIRRLPVVDQGKLVGTVSRADICRGALSAS
jgi:CBS domain-containing protein